MFGPVRPFLQHRRHLGYLFRCVPLRKYSKSLKRRDYLKFREGEPLVLSAWLCMCQPGRHVLTGIEPVIYCLIFVRQEDKGYIFFFVAKESGAEIPMSLNLVRDNTNRGSKHRS